MKLDRLKPEHLKELKRIQDSIPDNLLSKIIKKDKPGKKIKEALEKALKDPRTTKSQLDKAKTVLASGMLDREITVVDKKVEKKIDDYIDKQIEKSVRLGRLPDKKAGENLKKITKAKNG